LPVPRAATLEEMLAGGCDATRVSVVGALVNYAANPQGVNLEIQVGPRMFMARLAVGDYKLQDIPPGSRIQVTGTCVGQGWRGRGAGFESAELLMNSAADVQILQLPPWWNARRIVALLVVLITVLLLSLTWVYQLRRKVDQRTAQLNQEMRQRKEIELKHAAEQERSRIARDLHDDLGSSLTEISLLASVSLPSVASPENGQPTERFGVIAGKARLLVNSLDVIVWAADPEEDEIQSFVDYLSGFAREFLMASGLACRFKIPIEFPPLTVDGRIRHGLLLAVKETLNNVVRHAQASEVEFGLNVVGNQIEISIEDDGRGFDVATVMRGNGLNNLQERLAGLGGTCEIASRSGAGTTVKILLPIQSAT
jgi:signal transduction histidine kinase